MDRVRRLVRASEQSPALERFADLFFSRADETGFEGYGEESLAALVLAAWRFIASRTPGAHKIRVENPETLASAHGGVTVVEILNDDMPFLVDSLMGEVQERGLTVHLVSHPVLRVERDAGNALVDVGDAGGETGPPARGRRESYIQIHLRRIESADARAELEATLSGILDKVRTAVDDWKPMTDRLEHAVAAYSASPPPVPVPDLAESVQFLKWLLDDNFTFLGMCALAFVGGEERGRLEPVSDSGLGILRDSDVYVLSRGGRKVHMTPEIRQFFLAPAPLIVTKANVRSVVHRRAHMDYIGVKIYAESGEITGELRIVGLFTSTAYTRSTRNIPFLRHKVNQVIDRSGYPPGSHSGKALVHILENFPRDELFQIDVDQFHETALGILTLELRPRTRVFARIDQFDRFVSVLVYVPRDRFNTEARERIGEFLAETFNGRVSAHYLFFPEVPLVRIHFIIGRNEGETPRRSNGFLEEQIAGLIRTWEDVLDERLAREPDGAGLAARYADAFSPAYQAALSPDRAVQDIAEFEALSRDNPVAIRFYRGREDRPERVNVALYHLYGPIRLSRRVPVLENLGFSVIDERSYSCTPQDGAADDELSLHDMVLEARNGEAVDLEEGAARIEACFLAVWRGEAGNDAYNRLVRRAGLDWREAAVLRAYGSYLRQIGAPFGQGYLSDTLARHAGVTADLMALFRLRFDPADRPAAEALEEEQNAIVARIDAALEEVPSLDEDRILRHFLNLGLNTLRTNFYRRGDDGAPPAIAFKFDSPRVEGSPSPRPFAEIFVFSPRVQGIHLRGGRIARGGVRWSDRAQDFRTEVLNLAKAQQVKNTVIVPTGAKGGFVPARLPKNGGREEIRAEGVAAYKLYVSTLLSVTDNLAGGETVPPENVVRHDGDDPYLVVAADKGTATFSDYANEIALEHGFWLGDAFASGGSAGYDHKEMGVTARGAWEAVKRHFREMDRDIQSEPFTAIGVGDMSGDVFGNGMLLSQQTRLLAAFDHRDIFIDPDPDPAASWEERKRLFEMGRSSWQDYDTGLISAGGGVFSRGAKSISLSDPIRSLLGVEAKTLTPNELIRAVLRAQADLLWFGGIGTYVAAEDESPEQIGDRANDAVRVHGHELRVKVVGEGANLGMTQKGRIAFAMAGGRVNSDAIDNSGGVNSSDLEVNIKIATGAAVEAGKIDLAARNELLAEMTEEVAERCLRNNYLQTLAISLGERNGIADIGFQGRLMRNLERAGLLEREIEFLPDETMLEERRLAGQGLTRPELAVLLAYAKIDLHDALVDSTVPDDPFFARELFAYFPRTLRERFPDEIESHRLRREIIATRLANSIINRGGSTMFVRLKEETGHSAEAITFAFTAALAVFDLETVYREIDALDNAVSGGFQLDLYLRLQTLLRRQTAWFLRNVSFEEGLSPVTELYGRGAETVRETLAQVMTADQRRRYEADRRALEDGAVPEALAGTIATLRLLADAPEMVLVSERTGTAIPEIAGVYASVTDHFRLDTVKHRAETLFVSDYFDRLAINSTIGALSAARRDIVQGIVGGDGPGDLDAWLAANREPAERTRRALDEILEGELTLSRLMVAVGHLGDLGAG